MFKKTKHRGMILSQQQKQVRDIVVENLKNKTYKKITNPCLCGEHNDIIITKEDGYGIPLTIVICKSCGLIRCNPYLDEESLSDFYKNYYRILCGMEKGTKSSFDSRRLRGKYAIEHLKLNNVNLDNAKVFEIGCADGGILKSFQELGCEVYGCDYDKDTAKYGIEHGLTIEIGGLETLEKYGKADIVILSHVLEHVAKPVEFLQNVQKLLKQTGILCVLVPSTNSIEKYHNCDIFQAIHIAHVNYFSQGTLKNIFYKSCFNIEYTDMNNIGNIIALCKKTDDKQNMPMQNYFKNVYKQINSYEQTFKRRFFYKKLKDVVKWIFSVSNYYNSTKVKHKQIIIFGIKITFKAGKTK